MLRVKSKGKYFALSLDCCYHGIGDSFGFVGPHNQFEDFDCPFEEGVEVWSKMNVLGVRVVVDQG
jgi:hypothetical protein